MRWTAKTIKEQYAIDKSKLNYYLNCLEAIKERQNEDIKLYTEQISELLAMIEEIFEYQTVE